MPGSPSPGGRKPGICQTGQLVTRKGPEGSNPSPGAYFEEPSTSLKALAGESRVETTTMDGPTANKTIQTTITTTTDGSQDDNRLELSYLASQQEWDKVITARDSSADDGASSSAKSITLSTTPSQLDGIYDSITLVCQGRH